MTINKEQIPKPSKPNFQFQPEKQEEETPRRLPIVNPSQIPLSHTAWAPRTHLIPPTPAQRYPRPLTPSQEHTWTQSPYPQLVHHTQNHQAAPLSHTTTIPIP